MGRRPVQRDDIAKPFGRWLSSVLTELEIKPGQLVALSRDEGPELHQGAISRYIRGESVPSLASVVHLNALINSAAGAAGRVGPSTLYPVAITYPAAILDLVEHLHDEQSALTDDSLGTDGDRELDFSNRGALIEPVIGQWRRLAAELPPTRYSASTVRLFQGWVKAPEDLKLVRAWSKRAFAFPAVLGAAIAHSYIADFSNVYLAPRWVTPIALRSVLDVYDDQRKQLYCNAWSGKRKRTSHTSSAPWLRISRLILSDVTIPLVAKRSAVYDMLSKFYEYNPHGDAVAFAQHVLNWFDEPHYRKPT